MSYEALRRTPTHLKSVYRDMLPVDVNEDAKSYGPMLAGAIQIGSTVGRWIEFRAGQRVFVNNKNIADHKMAGVMVKRCGMGRVLVSLDSGDLRKVQIADLLLL